MAEQIQKQKTETKQAGDAITDIPTGLGPESQERVDKVTDDIDALLEDIEDVLVTNAEDFVAQFVQRGGE